MTRTAWGAKNLYTHSVFNVLVFLPPGIEIAESPKYPHPHTPILTEPLS